MNNPKEATGNEVMGHKEEGGSRNKKEKKKKGVFCISQERSAQYFCIYIE
jgi:hypothetical protein